MNLLFITWLIVQESLFRQLATTRCSTSIVFAQFLFQFSFKKFSLRINKVFLANPILHLISLYDCPSDGIHVHSYIHLFIFSIPIQLTAKWNAGKFSLPLQIIEDSWQLIINSHPAIKIPSVSPSNFELLGHNWNHVLCIFFYLDWPIIFHIEDHCVIFIVICCC